MKRFFATVIVLLLTLAQTLDANIHPVYPKRLRSTNIEKRNVVEDVEEGSFRQLAVDKEMKERLKKEKKEKIEQLKQSIEARKDEIKKMQKEYEDMKKDLEQDLKDMLEDLKNDSGEDIEPAEGGPLWEDVCKSSWTNTTGNNVNCIGGNLCYDPDFKVCSIFCSDPSSPLACDPNDTKCCDVCPCCDGCYVTQPDKCLFDELTNCICQPSNCCATHSCDPSSGDSEVILMKEEAKEKFKVEKEKLKQQKKDGINEEKQKIKDIKAQIKLEKEKLKDQIEQLKEGGG